MTLLRIHWRRLFVLCALVLGSVNARAEVQEKGYIELKDGVGLKYTVIYPEAGKRFPVLVQYNGYNAGNDPYDAGFGPVGEAALANGFAVLGVQVRGSGCSEGSFDLFEPRWADDAVQALDWASKQPWSNGATAMGGLSFPGITQLMVGPKRPPSLKAIMPWSGITDLYRDVSWPGGIFNPVFATIFDILQRQQSTAGVPAEVLAGDLRCALAVLGRLDPTDDVIVQGAFNPWADASIYQRPVADGDIDKIDVPVLATHGWQDEALASRVAVAYEQLNPETTWLVFGNGGHSFGLGSPFVVEMAESFLLHFVKGERNGFPSTPHVQILHEVSFDGTHRWVTSHDRWPVDSELTELYFSGDGLLRSEAPKDAASVNYVYPLPAPSMTATVLGQVENQTYQLPVLPGGAASFTTAPLAQDVEILGPSRADIWLSSTATDTDLQVSLIEVRADGREQFLQRGWLRVSQRKTETSRNQPNFVYHSHTQQDSTFMPTGEPVLASVEIWPVGHVFRAGSSIRVNVEAPLGTTGFRQLLLNPTPAINTVHFGGLHLSRITLPVVPKAIAPVDYSECGTLWNQPCRPNPTAVPEGALSLNAAVGANPDARGSIQRLGHHRFRLSNTGRAEHFLRAIEATSSDLPDGTAATLKLRDQSISTTSHDGKLRFELEDDTGLTAGQALEVELRVDEQEALAWTASLSNLAYAGADGIEVQPAPVGFLLLVLACLASARSRRYLPMVLLIGTLAACADSDPVDSQPGSSLRVSQVQAVDDKGQYFSYTGAPIRLE